MSGLRERIAEVIEEIGSAWDAQMMASIVDDKPEPAQSLADTQAQAIIDKFDFTSNGECGYVEIWGRYDTRFED